MYYFLFLATAILTAQSALIGPANQAPQFNLQPYQSIKEWLGCSEGQTHGWCSK